ncbi:diguanylate cyclase [Nostoc sp. FACHB-152]|uniref:diguanylate cyclase domain-containing protein n=1 Tax=unclassified Nostoc TaxID=2593658 RepID=UPI001687D742|nr:MULTISPECIES: diguanylate cyclase [unclassified Nostoc]MBD2446541.1 diguanylate cyclase [Nostoc sp. FACHB-152]MBD2468662.1 diguanylate cyclase [Nostoc sp. FACHB-145]
MPAYSLNIAMPSNSLPGSEIRLQQILNQIKMLAVRVHQSRELDEILNIVVSEVRNTLKSERVIIYRFLPDGDGVIAQESVNPAWKPLRGKFIYDPCFQMTWLEQYQQGRISVIEDIHTQTLKPCYKELLISLQVQANLVVPILVNSQNITLTYSKSSHLWGLLIAHQCSSSRQWSSLEIEYLNLLAAELGIAVRQTQQPQRLLQLNQHYKNLTVPPKLKLKPIKRTLHKNRRNPITTETVLPKHLSAAELIVFDRLQTPTWIYDIEKLQMYWANKAALTIWNAQSREELLKRNFSDVSESTRIRLQTYLQKFQQGQTISENWTFYPEGKPVWVRCLFSGIEIEPGRMAMLVEGSLETVNAIEQETLRSIEALRHTKVMISLYTMDGVPLMQNPAAQDCYGDTLHPNLSTQNVFLSHFVDPTVRQQAIEAIQLGEVFNIETQVFTNKGIRWHGMDIRCTRDPVTGKSLILVNEKDINKQQTALKERQSVEDELRWRSALLSSMTETSLLGFFVVDNRTDEILYFNHRFCEIWGIKHLENRMRLGTLKNKDIIPDCIPLIADLPAFFESCPSLQPQENRGSIEDEILFVDGRTIRRFSSQIRDSADKYFGRLYIFEDITERKRIEAAFKASEQRWQYALEGNGDGVWDWNIKTDEVFFSRRWKEMLGFAEHEIENTITEWEQRIHPDDKWQVYEELNKHLCGETQQYVSEHRVQCKDGTYKWILDRGQVSTRSEDGVPLRMLGTHIDITQRRRMEEALRESEQRYRSVITTMAEGIVLQQADGSITACNGSAERILGLTASQMMGRASIDERWRAVHEDGSPFPGETHPTVVTLRTGQPQFNVIMGVYKPDGSLTWISINSQPLFQPNELQPYAVVGSFTDITARKQAEIALQQQMERERMVSAIAQRLRQSLDLDQILNTTVADVRQFLQSDRVIIYRFYPDWSGIVISESVADGWQTLLNREITDDYIVQTQGQICLPGKLKPTSDIYTAGFADCHIQLLEQLQVKAKLLVPILQGDKLWGLLVAHHCNAPHKWQAWETELLQQLATQLEIAIQQAELYHQLKLANQQLENIAMVDQLTQIPNRRCFDSRLERIWQYLLREQGCVSLLLCDIDYFKQYNDAYGHTAGDDCLRLVAKAFKQTVKRATDLAARYGGEEFVVILPNTDSYGAFQVAQAIHQAIEQLNIPHVASAVKQHITLSIGIATVIPQIEMLSLDLIESADQALYQAKSQGRNRSCINQL